jgi:hypothetical protein
MLSLMVLNFLASQETQIEELEQVAQDGLQATHLSTPAS